jgi:hypothetical protein
MGSDAIEADDDSYRKGIEEAILKESSMNVTKAAMNLNLFLDDYKNGKRSREETSKVIIALIVESIQQSEKEQQHCLLNIVKNSQTDKHDENQECNKSELVKDKDKKMKVAPFLTQFGIPLHKEILSICLKEIVQVSKAFPKENIMSYTNWKGNKTNVVTILICTSKKSFMSMNNRTRFLDNLPCSVRGEKEEVSNDDVVQWILERFG